MPMRRIVLFAVIPALMLAARPTPAAEAPVSPPRLSLAQAIEMAAAGTATVRVADLKIREAEARRTASRSTFLPGLGGAASMANRTFDLKATGFSFPSLPGVPAFPDLIGPVDVVDARVRASQTLFDFASWVRVRAAGE